jgi:hypothetical protein
VAKREEVIKSCQGCLVLRQKECHAVMEIRQDIAEWLDSTLQQGEKGGHSLSENRFLTRM